MHHATKPIDHAKVGADYVALASQESFRSKGST
jgi:hypothetical protein